MGLHPCTQLSAQERLAGRACWKQYAEQGANRYDEFSFLDIHMGIVNPGFLQSFRYFENIEQIVRRQLRFRSELSRAASQALSNIAHRIAGNISRSRNTIRRFRPAV